MLTFRPDYRTFKKTLFISAISLSFSLCMLLCIIADIIFFIHIPKGTDKNSYSVAYSRFFQRRSFCRWGSRRHYCSPHVHCSYFPSPRKSSIDFKLLRKIPALIHSVQNHVVICIRNCHHIMKLRPPCGCPSSSPPSIPSLL